MTARANGALHGEVLDALGRQLVSGKRPAGAVMTLEAIAREHDVSVPMARECVRVLESMGMLSARRRVGVTVQPREGWHVFDPRLIRWRLEGADRAAQLVSLGELRDGFEPVAAGLAAARATAEQCAEMAAAVSDMAVHGRSGDLEAYLDADVRFHDTLLAASGNEMLRALAEVVAEVLAGRTRHDLMPARPNPDAIALHAAVADAVRDRDPEAAEAAMRGIIREASQAVARTGGGPGRRE